MPGMISLDTETTGIDLYHGAAPFFVTSCNEAGEQQWWEWAVDPETREVDVPSADLEDIQALIDGADELVLQNAKFDVAALQVTYKGKLRWPWEKVQDTLIAGHLLASNQPHDLTSMTLHYLGVDIEPCERRLKDACNAARRLARRDYPTWRIAKVDDPLMPSAKGEPWKLDGWLPRQLADSSSAREGWKTALSDYANADSAATLNLWRVQRRLLEEHDLWDIYLDRRKLLPVIAAMEARGVTVNRNRLEELVERYSADAEAAGETCEAVARSCGYELRLPRSGNNKSLTEFVFNVLKLPPERRSKKTGSPSLDKAALEGYEVTTEPDSKAGVFVRTLRNKRKRDTAITYMESYRRFWLPLPGQGDKTKAAALAELRRRRAAGLPTGVVVVRNEWFVLHPSLNPTGTDTLRMSSSNPNEQNISKQEGFNLRYVFGPAPGREWWALDYENIELRIPAYESGERELIDLFERPEDPPYYGSVHLLNFHTVYPDIWEQELREVGHDQVGPHIKKKYEATWYKWCKNGGFAVQYGAVERRDRVGTADRAFHREGSHARLKSRFSRLEALNKRWIAHAERYGYVETMPDRSVCPGRGYPLMCTRTEYGRVLPTVPLNYHVQSTAMWCMAKAMVRCYGYLADLGDHHIAMQVHDEMVFDLPASGARSRPVVERLRALMEASGEDIGVPLRVAASYHPVTWSESEDL